MMRAAVALFALSLAWAVPQAAGRQTGGRQTAEQPRQAASGPAVVPARATIDQYCVACHNARLSSGGLALDTLDPSKAGESAETWEKVVRKLQTRVMPPASARRPDEATYHASDRLADVDARSRRGGTSQSRASHAAADESRGVRERHPRSAGARHRRGGAAAAGRFGVRLRQHRRRARRVAVAPGALPVGRGKDQRAGGRRPDADAGQPRPTASVRTSRRTSISTGCRSGPSAGSRSSHLFPLDGEYEFRIRLQQTNFGNLRGLDYPQQVETTRGRRAGPRRDDRRQRRSGDDVRAPAECGRRDRGAADVSRARQGRAPVRWASRSFAICRLATPGALQPFLRSSVDTLDWTGPAPHPVAHDHRSVQRHRPGRHAEPAAHLHLPSRTAATHGAACARRILTTLARRAYRQPVDDADLQPAARRSTAPAGAKAASRPASSGRCRPILASPEVRLPRRARSRRTCRPVAPMPISDLELASRLSFFLWSSIPDDELLAAAASGTLRTPAVLEQQVRRMLADPKSRGAGRQLRRPVAAAAQRQEHPAELGRVPRLRRQPAAGDAARDRAALRERSCARTAASLDLLTADYTFVNERLARHYGIPNVYGSQLPPRRGHRRGAARTARTRQHPRADVARRADLAGRARQVGAREHSRHAAAAAAAGRPGAQGERAGPEAEDDARADGAASRQSDVRRPVTR